MASTGRRARKGSARPRTSARSARRAAILIAVALPAAISSGCGYSFSSRTNPHLQTVAVPIFENRTLEPGVEERLADRITDVFLADKRLRVVKEKDADSVIEGSIERYDRSPFSYDKAQNVQEYRVEMTLHVLYEDRKKNRVVWEEKEMKAWGTYSVSADLPGGVEEESVAQTRAIEKAAQDILIKTVQGW
jgi:hypothetical protein